MRRILIAAALALAPLAAHAQTEQQTLVDRATLSVQELAGASDAGDLVDVLKRARAVMICPQIFRAGFILGAEGGGCVLVARDGAGSWSAPAFYGMSTGSIGLQIGIQDSQLILMILTDKGLQAVMDSQFKVGADIGVAVATLGAGLQGATTAAMSADIVAFSHARGLFGGVAINGSLMNARTDWNALYYGHEYASRQIVIDMQANNPGANPLREILSRYGAK
jgi:lipid-binding SYLF domain-containing protein